MSRRATADDLPKIMEMLVRFHAENGMAPLAPQKVAHKVSYLLHTHGLIAAERGGVIVGILGIIEADWWYGHGSYLVDLFFFVEAEFRSENVGQELIAEYRDEAERRNCRAFIHVLNPARAKRLGRIATALGFQPMGYRVRVA